MPDHSLMDRWMDDTHIFSTVVITPETKGVSYVLLKYHPNHQKDVKEMLDANVVFKTHI